MKTVPLKDIGFIQGWIYGEEDIAKIEIGGDSDYRIETEYRADVSVKIYYHSKK